MRRINFKDMTPYFFDSLTRLQQAEILQHQSQYIYTRQEPEFTIDVYQLGDFFTEIYFHKNEENFIIIKSFYADTQRQSYLPEHKIRYMTYYRYSAPSA